MGTDEIRMMAESILKEIERSPENVRGEWASWALADQMNKLIEAASGVLPDDARAVLPARFQRSGMRSYSVARYMDIAIAARQVVSLLGSLLQRS
jgi:hypothetical protein